MSPSADLILVADIGGTNARFALADRSATTPLDQGSIDEYPVAQFASLADAAAYALDMQRATPGVSA